MQGHFIYDDDKKGCQVEPEPEGVVGELGAGGPDENVGPWIQQSTNIQICCLAESEMGWLGPSEGGTVKKKIALSPVTASENKTNIQSKPRQLLWHLLEKKHYLRRPAAAALQSQANKIKDEYLTKQEAIQ